MNLYKAHVPPPEWLATMLVAHRLLDVEASIDEPSFVIEGCLHDIVHHIPFYIDEHLG
jgi:hypothetical protein